MANYMISMDLQHQVEVSCSATQARVIVPGAMTRFVPCHHGAFGHHNDVDSLIAAGF
jgi:hypothetical protein